jgi:hypothetical protein
LQQRSTRASTGSTAPSRMPAPTSPARGERPFDRPALNAGGADARAGDRRAAANPATGSAAPRRRQRHADLGRRRRRRLRRISSV